MPGEMSPAAKGFTGAAIGAGLGAVLALVIWLIFRERQSTTDWHNEIAELAAALRRSQVQEDIALGIEMQDKLVDVKQPTWEEITVPIVAGVGIGLGVGGAIGLAASSLVVGLIVGACLAAVIVGVGLWGFQEYDRWKLRKLVEQGKLRGIPIPEEITIGAEGGELAFADTSSMGGGSRTVDREPSTEEAGTSTIADAVSDERERREGDFTAYSARLAERVAV